MAQRGLSLRWRMVLIVAGVLLVLLTPAFIYVARQYQDAYRQAYWGKGDLITIQLQQTIETVAPYVENLDDAPGLGTLLRDMVNPERNKEFDFIALVDDTGKVIVHSTPGYTGALIPELTDLEGDGVIRRRFPTGDIYLISRSMPLPGNEGRTLYIVVGEKASLVDPAMTPLAIVGVFSAALLVGLLALLLENLIVTPLRKLAEGAALIGAGDLAYRITLGRRDELGFVAHAFNDMAGRLSDLVTGLEKRVVERTTALERKTSRLEAVSLVSKEAAQVRSVPVLLDITVAAISEKFGFYHTGIFRLDDAKEWAVLRAASSEGGKRMLNRGHRLKVGEVGIVGIVASTGKPRVAFNVGEDAIWFNNPDLPNTRSEMALPLKVEEEIIGVLDVQSEEPAAFTDEDINALQLMADQVAIALHNTHLLETTQDTLEEVRDLQIDYSRRGWSRLAARMRPLAYEYDRVDVYPVSPLPVPAELVEGRASHRVVMDGGTPVLMETMRLGDRVIGCLGLVDPQRSWNEQELALVESVGEQVAMALDNARLFADAQRNERQQYLISSVLQVAANPDVSRDQVLVEIARILALGLDMAVAIFTFPFPNLPLVHRHTVLDPDGQMLPFFEEDFSLSEEHHTFFRGLIRPELGPLTPLVGTEDLDRLDSERRQLREDYDFKRVLYVPISSAGVQTGFIAMIQRQGEAPLDPDTRDLAQSLASQIAVVIDNLNLTEQTRQRSEELQSLYLISLILSELLEPMDVLNAIVEQGTDLFSADASCFFLYEAETDSLVLVLDYHNGAEGNLGYRLKRGEGLSWHALGHQRTLFVDDYEVWEGSVLALHSARFRAAMAVPMIGRTEPLGVLMLRSERTAAFGEREARLADLFSAQAATALQNAQLNKEAQRRAGELSLLYEAGIDLLTILDMRQLLGRATSWARRVFDAPASVVFYRDPDTGTYLREQSADSPERLAGQETEMPDAGGFTETVMNTRKGILVRDNRDHAGDATNRLVEAGLLSQMGVPLRVGDTVVGTLFAVGTEVGQFGQRDLDLLDFLATQVSSAIQNARQFGKTELALSVVGRQARYQTNVSRAVALMTERGTEAVADVLRLLGEASRGSGAVFFAASSDEKGDYWRMRSFWNVAGAPTDRMSDPSLQRLSVEALPVMAEHLVDRPALMLRPDELPASEGDFLRLLQFSTVLLLPVQGEEAYPSFIAIGRETDDLWADEEIVALQTAAAALSNTIARERLFHQVESSLQETEALYEGSAELNAANTYEAILEVVRRYTILGQGAHDVTLQLFAQPWSDGQKTADSEVVARWTTKPVGSLVSHYTPAEFALLSTMMRSTTPTFIEDVAGDALLDEPAQSRFAGVLGAKSLAFVPLVAGGQRIGYMSGIYPEGKQFSEADRRRLESLTRQASIAVQNIRQLRTIQARALRERMIREITEKIQAAPDVEGVLQTALRELGRAFGTTHSRVQFRMPAQFGEAAPDENET